MSEATGPLIASGRAADVFDRGDGTVLRRYRGDRDTDLEGRMMVWLADQGVRCPRVHHFAGNDIVMDQITGPTMLEDLQQHPWRLLRHAETLASLQRELNCLIAPEWFPRNPAVPDKGMVVHVDLHPLNIILGPQGPIIIDWTNAASGDGAFDAAMTYVIMSTFETSGPRDRIGQRILVAAFARSRGRSLVRAALREACAYRLADRNITVGERAAVERALAREEHRASD